MNAFYRRELEIGELVASPDRVLGVGSSDSTLHFCSPAHGGWGVVRTALLVPESYLLFVCPAACGRHGAIAAVEQGYKNRVGYLCIEENEIVLGGYEAEIERGVAEVLRRLPRRPRALMVCVSCIDDLLGTDHEAALGRMEAEHGIPIRLARMNPIQLDGKLPPGQRIQKTMYDFIDPSVERDRGVVLLGSYVPPDSDSELGAYLAALGYGPIRHPGLCADFDEFARVSRSAAALVLRPEGTAAAASVSGRLGIPSFKAPVSFSAETVRSRYAGIAEFLRSLPAAPAADRLSAEALLDREEAAAASRAAELRGLLGGARVAVDSSATASPFDLALALTEAGIDVVRVYAEKLPVHEEGSFARLAKARPGLVVSNPSHAEAHGGRPRYPLADVAIGFAAGYASMARTTVPLAYDEGLCGFRGFRAVLDAVSAAVSSGDADLERQVRDYGLVV